MIKPKYGVKCLHLGFDRYKRYCKLPVTVKPSSTTISFYVEKPSTPKGKNARVSNHHPNIQHYTDDGRQPWLTDNVSIEFIVPRSKEDKKRYRARVEQNASGTIHPFDVTTYQYDSTLIDPTDITTIFKAIIVFLNGGGYTDPFIGTPKRAKALPRHSNIKPHRGSASSTPLTCSRNISIDENYLNEMTIYCLGDIIPLNENKQYNKNKNMKQTIKLRESELKQMVKETVNRILNEAKTIRKVEYSKMPYDKKTQQDIDWRNYQNKNNQSVEYVDDGDNYIGGYDQYELDDKDINSNIDNALDDMQRSLGKFNQFDRPSKGEKSMKILGYLDGDSEHRDALSQPFLGDDGAYHLHQKRLYNKNIAKRNSDADKRWKKAADSRPLHRKGSLNRAMDETINRIVSESIRNIR